MKKLNMFIVVFLFVIGAHAQDYTITFAGIIDGAEVEEPVTIDSVRVQNLSTNVTVMLRGGELLELTQEGSTGVNRLTTGENGLIVYPNPIKDYSKIEFITSSSGYADVEVYDASGRLVIRNRRMVQAGSQSFSVAGLDNGIYSIRVRTPKKSYSATLLSVSHNSERPVIQFEGSNSLEETQGVLKTSAVNPPIEMVYAEGERLLIHGMSGPHTRVLTMVPTATATVNLKFYKCEDKDGNNYAVVEMNNGKIWMAENLRTTKLNDGTEIAIALDAATWDATWRLDTPCLASVNYDPTQDKIAGLLYTRTTVKTEKLCPEGWKVPSADDWDQDVRNLTSEDNTLAGGPLKETGTTLWYQNTNDFATNATGFSARPNGVIANNGSFSRLTERGFWWTTSAHTTNVNNNLTRHVMYNTNTLHTSNYGAGSGLGVRCVKD